jgi:outer membrane protein
MSNKEMNKDWKLKNIKRLLFYIFNIIITMNQVKGQSTITIGDALKMALLNNYNIIIGKNDSEINKTNNTLGNSGFLPIINFNASNNFSINNIDQQINTQSGITNIKKQDAVNKTINTNIALSWTLFDGGKMFIAKERLKQTEAEGEMKLKSLILETIFNVTTSYYNVVQLKQQLLSINEVIAYNTERVKILQTIYNNGLSPKNALLQAKIDLNVYKENAIKQQNTIKTSKRALNQLLGRSSEIEFEVPDSIPTTISPQKENLINKLFKNNIKLLALQKKVEINFLTIKELEANRYPKLNLNSAYNINKINNSAGNILKNNNNGITIGAALTIPIFEGGNTNRQIKVAKIQNSTENTIIEQMKKELLGELETALDQYTIQSELLKVEIENEALAKENLSIAIERLRYGQTNTLELRQAQESYVESETRKINFNYNLKLAEAKIKLLVAEF